MDLGSALIDVLRWVVETFFVLFACVVWARVSVDYYFERKHRFLRGIGMPQCEETSRGK